MREAAALGLDVALVRVRENKLTVPWGTGPRIFRNDNLPDAEEYGRYLSAGLRDESNVVWVFGGDRPARIPGLKSESIDQTVTIDLTKLRTQKLRVWWYYPRTGIAKPLGVESHGAQSAFKMPPRAPNWVLVLEDPKAGYTPRNS